MTIIYLTEYNTRCYEVTFENIGCIKVQKYKDIWNYENNIICVELLEIFLGKSEVSNMTLMSRAFDKLVFDGNTVLVKTSEQNDKHRYLYIGGDMISSFLTNDNIFKYISKTGNNLTSYSIAVGHESVYFLTPRFEYIK